MCVKLALMCATDDGSGAHVLQIVLDRSLPKPGELERNVIRPSRSLTRAQTRNLQSSFGAFLVHLVLYLYPSLATTSSCLVEH